MPPVTETEEAEEGSPSENEPSAANQACPVTPFKLPETTDDLLEDHCATGLPSSLPSFSVIRQSASTGLLSCPITGGGCTKEFTHLDQLKAHYRTAHCGNNYRPFRCVFDLSTCRFAAHLESTLEEHICTVHFSTSAESCIESGQEWTAFMQTRTDLLAQEEALFNGAKVEMYGLRCPPPLTTPPDNEALKASKPVRFVCPLCSKRFTKQHDFRLHNRTHHARTKPFRCTLSGCGHQASTRQRVRGHVLAAHLNVPWRNQKALSEEQKAAANQFVELEEEVLQQEAPDIAMASVVHLPEQVNHSQRVSGHGGAAGRTTESIAATATGPSGVSFEPASCRFAANSPAAVEQHIRSVHFFGRSGGITDGAGQTLQWSTFMHSRADWLAQEEALFNRAKIEIESETEQLAPTTTSTTSEVIPSPEVDEIDPGKFVCPVCLKRYMEMDDLRHHHRAHSGSKPYRCLLPGCGQRASSRMRVRSHVLAAHFNVPWRQQKHLTAEQKDEATQYVEELGEELRQEEAALLAAIARMKTNNGAINEGSSSRQNCQQSTTSSAAVITDFKDYVLPCEVDPLDVIVKVEFE
ncbi:hypothetical protein TYRP_007717 [Tyrophagus putrescentiae]|nr:hypothetical protein TYRP_007717 [Tyrophagus putrescentiae]